MVDEGMAREVINRIQKLRKKGFFSPSILLQFPWASTELSSRKITLWLLQKLKGSELELTLTRGSCVPGPACAYNQTDLLSLSGRTLCVTAGAAPSPVNSPSALLCHYINLQLLNAEPQGYFCAACASSLNSCTHFKVLCITGWCYLRLPPLLETSSPELTCFLPSSPECLTGTVGTLLLENPLGQNGLSHQGLVYEAAKVFGLRSRRLKLFLNETQTQGEAAVPKAFFLLQKEIGCQELFMCPCENKFCFIKLAAGVSSLGHITQITEEIPMKTLNMKTVYVSVLPTTADG
ncbi:hypothetical protein A6R68_04850 [Neotoma lepida]|uniref:Isoleucine--tRNA ligase cytoplasmic ubiquitin-like domain-containing protein n=1 Tax=Neotoma lepida TaxID=56216 RepID=A0A1A6GLL7_NEOLE|nr:hypothetical protein A6R68_04850 [Neotoma lepida]